MRKKVFIVFLMEKECKIKSPLDVGGRQDDLMTGIGKVVVSFSPQINQTIDPGGKCLAVESLNSSYDKKKRFKNCNTCGRQIAIIAPNTGI
jgi:hypothetical protein